MFCLMSRWPLITPITSRSWISTCPLMDTRVSNRYMYIIRNNFIARFLWMTESTVKLELMRHHMLRSDMPFIYLGSLKYNFLGVHFHWSHKDKDGSEHAVDGHRSAMEVNISTHPLNTSIHFRHWLILHFSLFTIFWRVRYIWCTLMISTGTSLPERSMNMMDWQCWQFFSRCVSRARFFQRVWNPLKNYLSTRLMNLAAKNVGMLISHVYSYIGTAEEQSLLGTYSGALDFSEWHKCFHANQFGTGWFAARFSVHLLSLSRITHHARLYGGGHMDCVCR